MLLDRRTALRVEGSTAATRCKSIKHRRAALVYRQKVYPAEQRLLLVPEV